MLSGKKENIEISFNPNMKTDKISGEIKSKLSIHFDHPYVQFVQCVGKVCFPNLELSKTEIDFGSILNFTQKKISIKMKNTSVMPVEYEWKFSYQNNFDDDPSSNIILNDVFDILPLNGTLQKG